MPSFATCRHPCCSFSGQVLWLLLLFKRAAAFIGYGIIRGHKKCQSIRYTATVAWPLPPTLEPPLPDLGDIQWGEFADEHTRGVFLLKAAMERPNGP